MCYVTVQADRRPGGAATEYCASVAAAPGLLSELLLCYNSYEFLHYA